MNSGKLGPIYEVQMLAYTTCNLSTVNKHVMKFKICMILFYFDISSRFLLKYFPCQKSTRIISIDFKIFLVDLFCVSFGLKAVLWFIKQNTWPSSTVINISSPFWIFRKRNNRNHESFKLAISLWYYVGFLLLFLSKKIWGRWHVAK